MRWPHGLIFGELGIDRGGSAQQGIAGEGLGGEEICAEEVGIVVEVEPAHIVLAETPLAASEAGILQPLATA